MSPVSRCVKQFQSKCSFSIDHILNVAGEKAKAEESFNGSDDDDDERKFDWLNCTRYRPPKLQRQRKRDGIQRRKLGRNPRIPFSSSQVALLEAKFMRTPYLSSSDVTELADNLHLSETRVKIWFQNRRARERRDRETKGKVANAGNEDSRRRLSREAAAVVVENALCATLPNNLRVQQCNPHALPQHHHGNGAFVQLYAPLDLSERHLNAMQVTL